ncbi:RNA polymerase sigma factor [Parapedobacter sp. GCM10030251]|uniref:RNA polymerase sigma factor n=1 Tax=Parapedobacter sp. GCM10030251 TaxID=3273419 RepID=UPI00361656FA
MEDKMTDASAADEKVLLQQLQKGDHEAFEILYHSYSKVLYWHLDKMVKDADLAEELLQELFIKVWHSRAKIQPDLPFVNFLYVVAKQLSIDHYRRLARRSRVFEYLGQRQSEAVETTEKDVMGNEARKLLDEAIAALPLQRRKAFELCKIEGKSYKEAAEIMGVSPFTIQNHVAKATHSVKEYVVNRQTPPSAEMLALFLAAMLYL